MKKKKNIPELRFPEFSGEWESKKLGEVTAWKSGGTPSMSKNEYWNGDIPWISASSMQGTEYSNSEVKITNSGLKAGSTLAKKGELLLLVRGSMLFRKIPIGITLIDVAFNQDVKGISASEEIFNRFLLNWFLSKEVNIKNLVTVTGIGAGKLDTIGLVNFPISFPTLPEQKKIANFLTSIDERLQTLKKKKTALEQYKKGVMQKIFSQKIRFKDENGRNFPKWEVKRVKEIFEVTRGNVLSMTLVRKDKDKLNVYPVYSSQTKNKGLTGYYSNYLFENSITWTTDGAGAGDVNFRSGKFYCTNVCGVLLNDKGYSNLLVAEILNTVSRKHVSYVGNPKLMNNVMRDIQILIPKEIEEQLIISDFLSSIDDKIDHCKKEIEKTELYKKGLLQKMFV